MCLSSTEYELLTLEHWVLMYDAESKPKLFHNRVHIRKAILRFNIMAIKI